MNNVTHQCARCKQPLKNADDVCPFCDIDARPNGGVVSKFTGKYNCPKCALKFDRPARRLTPETVPWHRMHPEKPCCPHCHVFIRSKYSKVNTALGWLIVPLIVSREWFGFTSPAVYVASIVIVGVCFTWWGVAAWRLHRDANAYIEDTRKI